MREKLIELFYDNNVRCDQKIEGLADDVMDIIANGVTIPVRCKDCKWCDDFDVNGIGLCWENERYVHGDDFCSDGERRKGECT